MSYSVTVAAPLDRIVVELKAAANGAPREGQEVNGTAAEFDAHLAAACDALGMLVVEAGYPAARVTFSGHVNPGHAPADGWADDCLNLSVAFLRSVPTVAASINRPRPPTSCKSCCSRRASMARDIEAARLGPDIGGF